MDGIVNQWGEPLLEKKLIDGHTYFVKFYVDPNSEVDTNQYMWWCCGNPSAQPNAWAIAIKVPGVWYYQYFTYSASQSGGYNYTFFFRTGATALHFIVKNYQIHDLTEDFGAGNEPSSGTECKEIFPLPYYSYSGE